ncbi:MAG: glutamine synthetase family protein [Pseudomonadota bacterium]
MNFQPLRGNHPSVNVEETVAQTSEKALLVEIDAFIKRNPTIDQVELIASDLNGNFFGKRYPIGDLRGFAKNGLTIPRAMYVLSTTSESMAEAVDMGGEDGDPDFNVEIVPGTLSVIDWGARLRGQALLASKETEALVDPRRVLSRVLNIFSELELTPVVAVELEFSLFENDRTDGGAPKTVINPKTGAPDKPTMLDAERLDSFEDFLDDVLASCASQGVRTSAVCAEYGAGQFEINFPHYSDALTAADHAQLFRRTVKAVARKHGVCASFMAKPGFDRAGNGQHLHVSVLDKNGENIFGDGDKHTERLLHAIGGLQQAAREAMLFWAPNINSYRRFEPENCVPTGATWAFEHRHVGFRIPIAKAGAWRTENRIPGADANCYLTLAATLAGVLHGLKNKIDPGPETQGAPDMDPSSLPLTINNAIVALRDGEVLSEYLDPDFTALFANHREGELRSFERFISAREVEWYL